MGASRTSGQIKKDDIIGLLSDAEIGKVSMAETKKSLATGDQYIDLNNLASGVQTAKEGGGADLDDIVPKSAVDAKTWSKLVARLKTN